MSAKKFQLSESEIGLIKNALEETINVLLNRFEQNEKFVHPAKKYEALYDRLEIWTDALPVSVYSVRAKEIKR